MTSFFRTARRPFEALLLFGAAVFLALHYVHLTADFPNNSPWMDWAKYTDEGWYGDAAIRHFQLGHWYLAGDFNPAVALPVLPLLEGVLFYFTGVSLAAVRALTVTIFAGILVAGWLLIRRTGSSAWLERHGLLRTDGQATLREPQEPGLSATLTVLLLAVSPYAFSFTRLAVIEPLLVLLMLLALLTAASARSSGVRSSQASALSPAIGDLLGQNVAVIFGLGVLLPTMILTKTTALFLTPALAWMLFAALGRRLRAFLIVGLPAVLLGGLLWLAYFLLLVRPHYLLDYRYLFSANAYTGITPETAASVLWQTIRSGCWISPVLYPASIAAVLFALATPRRLAREPLIPALILWATGYAAFLSYHDNIQPRYYFVITFPVVLLVPLVFEHFLLPRVQRRGWRRALVLGALSAWLLLAATEASETLAFVRRPQYTLIEAAQQIRDYIARDQRRDPTHSALVLSISGSDLSLMTGCTASTMTSARLNSPIASSSIAPAGTWPGTI